MRTIVWAVALVLAVAVESGAQLRTAVRIEFANGGVSIYAPDVLATEVLAAWANVGQTEIKGAELLESRRVTLKLYGVREPDALQQILGEGFGYSAGYRLRVESGLSTIERLAIGIIRPVEPPDPYDYPELRFSYYVPEKTQGETFGAPVYERLDPLPPAPEQTYEYFHPEKTRVDFGVPEYTQIDAKWTVPETRFEYYAKVFTGKWSTEVLASEPGPWIDPEKRFQYYHPPKAVPQP